MQMFESVLYNSNFAQLCRYPNISIIHCVIHIYIYDVQNLNHAHFKFWRKRIAGISGEIVT